MYKKLTKTQKLAPRWNSNPTVEYKSQSNNNVLTINGTSFRPRPTKPGFGRL